MPIRMTCIAGRTGGFAGRLATVLTGLLVVLGASWGNAYRFVPRSPDDLITAADSAARWDLSEGPVSFAVPDTGNLPASLDFSQWTRIVRESAARWNGVSTSALRLEVAVAEPAADGSTGRYNGISEIIFDARAAGVRGSAAVLSDWGRESVGPASREEDWIRECDVRINPEFPEYWFREGIVEQELRNVVTHELGHCLGLRHTEPYPFPTFLVTEGRAPRIFQPSPMMAYTDQQGELAADDRAGLSLLYPAPGFRSSTGAIAGRVLLGGTPARFAYVQTFRAEPDPRPGPGAFADENGAFHIEAILPGRVLLWVHPIKVDTGVASPALLSAAEAAGVLRFQDHLRWAAATAGETLVIPDITLAPGR